MFSFSYENNICLNSVIQNMLIPLWLFFDQSSAQIAQIQIRLLILELKCEWRRPRTGIPKRNKSGIVTMSLVNIMLDLKQEGPWVLCRSPENDWSVEWNHMWNFGRVHHEEQFYEIILNLGQCFRRRWCLKDFLSGALSSGSLPVWCIRTIYAI